MRVLVTGGAGFIGSHLVRSLARQGHELTVLDSLSHQIHGEDARKSPLFMSIQGVARFVHGSVCDADLVARSLEGQDAIVHLAAETGTGQSMYEIRRYVDVNVGGTAVLLDLLANRPHRVRRLVVASSRAVYGEGKYRDTDGSIVYPVSRSLADLRAGRFEPVSARTGQPLTAVATDEDSRLNPTSLYGVTKLTQEQMVMSVCPSLGIDGVALRYQNVFGPGQSLQNPYTGILSIFSTRILNGNPVNVFEDGLESRDFVFIDDAVMATTLAVTEPRAANMVFGIGSGVATSVLYVARSLARLYARSTPIEVTGAFRAGDIRHNFADLARSGSLLGYEPVVTFEQGLAEFTRWVLTQEVPRDQFERSLKELADKGLFTA